MKQRPDSLTVVFLPASADQNITTLSSLKVSQALEMLCPEIILEIRPNTRINVIAVDTRNGQTSRALLSLTNLCGMTVKVTSPFPVL